MFLNIIYKYTYWVLDYLNINVTYILGHGNFHQKMSVTKNITRYILDNGFTMAVNHMVTEEGWLRIGCLLTLLGIFD